MVSVVIPALNESARIGAVIRHALRSSLVTEVIVVDDGSVDSTCEIAQAAGARVIISSLLGKGASLEDGVRASHEDCVLFLDGDLNGMCDDLVERLCTPLLEDRADFVKARFSRAAGRVTVLTAKPLLQTFFPDLAAIGQPLGGICAARRTLLQQLSFETDYGVDVGLLIDARMRGARILEVDIGHLEHDSQSLEALGDMAKQVVRTILRKAEKHGRFSSQQVSEVEEVERHAQEELSNFFHHAGGVEGIALFDMDGTLVQGRFIVALAEETGRTAELLRWLDNPSVPDDERSRRIAGVFAGVPKQKFVDVARQMPLTPGAPQAIVDLKRSGYRVGIVSDSYRVATEIIRRRVFADFSIAHLLRFADGSATGALTISPLLIDPQGCAQHRVCKSNVLQHLRNKLNIAQFATVTVGDGPNDECMLRNAGISVAFEPKSKTVENAATHCLRGSLQGLAALLPPLQSRVAANA